MKIRYKKITTRPINLTPFDLIRYITNELDKELYQVINLDRTSVGFYYNIWRVGSRTEAFSKVDGGTFEIDINDKTVTFSYYVSLTFELFLIAIVLFFGLTNDYHILIFIIFILIMFLFRMMSVKGTANDMIGKILMADL